MFSHATLPQGFWHVSVLFEQSYREVDKYTHTDMSHKKYCSWFEINETTFFFSSRLLKAHTHICNLNMLYVQYWTEYWTGYLYVNVPAGQSFTY